ncbi:MAG: glycosyltransferase family 2 protein [bacterium]
MTPNAQMLNIRDPETILRETSPVPDVSLVLPAYNEEGNIAPLVEKAARAFADNSLSAEIIFVNDGSTDGTLGAIRRAARDYSFVRVVSHPKKMGLTEVLKTGLRLASGSILLFLPSDLESDPEEDIPKLLNEINKGYDVVAGWRQGRQDGKVLASKVYNFVCRKFFKVSVHDMNWIKAVRRDVFVNTRVRWGWYRFMLPLLSMEGYRIGEVKTNWYPRKSGRTGFGRLRLITSFFDFMALLYLVAFRKRPLLFFGALGSSFLGIAALLGLGLVIWHPPLLDPTTRVLLGCDLLVGIAGVVLFAMGFLAEQVVEGHDRMEELQQQLKKMHENRRPRE